MNPTSGFGGKEEVVHLTDPGFKRMCVPCQKGQESINKYYYVFTLVY